MTFRVNLIEQNKHNGVAAIKRKKSCDTTILELKDGQIKLKIKFLKKCLFLECLKSV